MKESLLLLDTVSIKQYIFATRYLKEIRGASALLDQYNRQVMKTVVAEKAGEAYTEIYANGGSGMFIVPTDSARSIAAEISRLYHEIGARLNAVSIPFNRETDNFQAALINLNYQAVKKRDSTASCAWLTHSFFRDCDSNKREYAMHREKKGELLFLSTIKKREANEEIKKELHQHTTRTTLWGRLNTLLKEKGYPDLDQLSFPGDFKKIADKYDRKNYIALLYADGNDMGKSFRQLQTIDELKKFSTVIDAAIYGAAAQAIFEHLRIDNMQTLPFDILMIGGDDLVMVVPAQYALPLALTLGREFHNLTNGKTLSIGVAFAKPGYPVQSLLHTTESLLKSAKKARVSRLRKKDKDPAVSGMINYMLIQQSSLKDWEDYIHQDLTAEEKQEGKKIIYQRTCRPFTFGELENLITRAEELKKVAFPPGKLQLLQDSVFKNYFEAIFQTIFVLTRCKTGKNNQRKALEALLNFPAVCRESGFRYDEKGSLFCCLKEEGAITYTTPILDLLEIYPFISSTGEVSDAY